MRFKDLKLGAKQIVVFSIILIIVTGAYFLTIHKMRTVKNEMEEVTSNWLPRALAIADINHNTLDLRLNQLQFAFATDKKSKQAQAANMINLIDKINGNLDTYEVLKKHSEEKNLYTEHERNLYADFDSKWEQYQDLSFTFYRLSRENQTQEALNLLNDEAKEVFESFGADLRALVSVNQQDAFAAALRAEKTFRDTRFITTILLLSAIVLSVFLAGVLVRYITVPVQQLEKAARSVADGNLDIKLDILSKDELGNLSQSFNRMTTSLREATEKLKRQNKELEEKSNTLEKQKAEIVQKNLDLYAALEELKSTQEQLLMKEKMAALGDLVAGVAHEINNPIGTVNSSIDVSERCIQKIEMVLETSKSIEDIKNNQQLLRMLKILKDNIRVTLTAGKRIATIVKSLKNFARLDEAEYQKVDINEGIESSLTLLGSEYMQNITVIKEYGDIPRIECYPGQLNQVFINLLKNAAQSIEGKGAIGIKTFVENDYITVQVSDNGIGIPKQRLEGIFEFGFSAGEMRVKMSTGLSTAYNIVQRHNGDIRVDSEVGKGSKFSVRLPFK